MDADSSDVRGAETAASNGDDRLDYTTESGYDEPGLDAVMAAAARTDTDA